MNEDCLFCKIAAGKLPATIVYQDDEVVAFADINPQAPTHVLLIPRRHVSQTLDLTAADGPLLGRLVEAGNQIARERGLENGFRLVINNGPGAGQTVYHLHVHLLGGRALQWPPG